jgi:hypothetical protein
MRRAVCTGFALVIVLSAAAAASALQQPGRTLVRGGPVTAVGLTHGSIAYAVGRTTSDCDHVELWNTDTRGTRRFGRKRPCGDLPLFSGIGPVAVASSRVVWVSFAGGNLTDWELWTATTTNRTPRRLRFVERDTSEPPAIVVGPGTERAVPYAVGTEITWLGADGARVFRTRVTSEVRAITSGDGPHAWRVAALLGDGDVVVLDEAGDVVATLPFAPGTVKWLGLAPRGLLVQVSGARVEFHGGASTTAVQLRANAIVLDFAEGRLLYRVGQSFWLRHVGSGAETLLLQGSRKHPLAVALDTHGLAWGEGPRVHWACSVCLDG